MRTIVADVGVGSDHQSISNQNLLVRELTHRIKNEFASVICLVSAVAARSTNDEVKATLSAVTNLLDDYAGVHRALQMPACSEVIDASGYIRSLCQSITCARLEKRNIELTLVADPLQIRSEQCWKLGLILSELVTNSARHAFGDHGGTIRVELFASGPFVLFRVTDNGSSGGPFMPGEGTKIIDALAEGLNGTIVRRFEPAGATTLLIFPINGETPQIIEAA